MIRDFFKSTYFKTALAITISGGILILFYILVKSTSFSIGFEKLNDTLMPIYIGCFISFILCPIYNKLVKHLYPALSRRSAARHGVKAGKVVVDEMGHHVADGLTGSIDDSKSAGKNGETDVSEIGGSNRSRRSALRWARAISTAICMLLLLSGVFLIGYLVLPQVIESIVTVVETMPQKLETLSEWTTVHLSRFPEISSTLNRIANAGMEETIEWVQEHIFNMDINGQSFTTVVSQGFMSVLNAFVDFFIGILISIYLLNYKEKLFAIGRKLIAAIFSEKRSKRVFEFTSIINDTFINFIVGRILDAIVIGIITYIVLSLLRFNMPLLIAVIVGITNVIPFFGPFIGAIPSFFLLLLDSPVQALWFVLIIFIIQQLDGNVIGPNIVGTALGMPSFWVLLSVLIGGGLFGFLGMFLGVPTFAVVYKYIDKGASRRLKRKDKPSVTYEYIDDRQFSIDKEEIYDEQNTR